MRRQWLGLVLAAWLLPSLAWAQGSPLPPAQQQFSDANGAPLAAGSVRFCVPNTNCGTLKATYKDLALTQQNTNPVLLDGAGRASIFGTGTYEEHVYDLNGVQVFSGITTAVNGSLLLTVPPGSVLGNPATSSAPAQSVPVIPPLGFSSAGLTYVQKLVPDNTNQLVDSTFANTERYTTGTNNLTYTLSASIGLYSGFNFTIISNVYVTVMTSAGDTFQPIGGTAISLFPGQVTTLTTNGAGLWFIAASSQLGPPVTIPGQVIQMRGTACPAGTLQEDGSLVSRTTYSLLFAAIGTTWGVGDGSTTFGLPNAGGQFNRGWEPGQTTDSGRAFASAQADAFQKHTFNYVQTANGNVVAGGSGFTVNSGVVGGSPTVGAPVQFDTPSGTPRVAAETRPSNITALSCIGTGRLY